MAGKVPARKTIRHNPDAPGPIQAAQIALVLMATAKATTWADVARDDTLREKVELTDEQQKTSRGTLTATPILAEPVGAHPAAVRGRLSRRRRRRRDR